MSMKPTREQIETATPERLNTMCAEMMGWKPHPNRRSDAAMAMIPPSGKGVRVCPQYATDDTLAMKLAEQHRMVLVCNAPEYYAFIPTDIESTRDSDGTLIFTAVKENGGELSPCPTLPLAICRAALLWWIEQGESEA